MNQAVRVVNLVLFIVNIALFGLWFSMIRRDAIPAGGEAATYMLSNVSLLLTVLGLLIGLGGLLLAGLGYLGFQTVLERAEKKADETAREIVTKRMQDIEKNGVPLRMPLKAAPLPDVGQATEEEDL